MSRFASDVLARDRQRSRTCDLVHQSQLIRKSIATQFGTPGGEPFGLLLGDYQIRPRPFGGASDRRRRRADGRLAGGRGGAGSGRSRVHPSMFGWIILGTRATAALGQDFFEQLEYLKWNAFRQTEDARFVGRTSLYAPPLSDRPQGPSRKQ